MWGAQVGNCRPTKPMGTIPGRNIQGKKTKILGGKMENYWLTVERATREEKLSVW